MGANRGHHSILTSYIIFFFFDGGDPRLLNIASFICAACRHNVELGRLSLAFALRNSQYKICSYLKVSTVRRLLQPADLENSSSARVSVRFAAMGGHAPPRLRLGAARELQPCRGPLQRVPRDAPRQAGASLSSLSTLKPDPPCFPQSYSSSVLDPRWMGAVW